MHVSISVRVEACVFVPCARMRAYASVVEHVRHSSKKRHFMQNEEEILREPEAQETKLTVIMTEMMTQACERVSVCACGCVSVCT